MITCALRGGLGNLMFQIATTSALAWRNNDIAVFDPENHHLPLQGRKVHNYINNIFRSIDFESFVKHDSVYKEPDFGYTEIPYTRNMLLAGYFQSDKYFSAYREQILNLFSPDSITREYIKNKYAVLYSDNTTSIHIRRGDYLKFRDIHPVCGVEYYKSAMNHLPGNTNYLVFSDDPDWCLDTFNLDRFTVIEENYDYIDINLMSMCNNHIIANSSFSWWGAWLNNNPDKIVVAPKKWFGPAINHSTRDLIPDSWVTL